MKYKETTKGRRYSDTRAECLYPKPETHEPYALLLLRRFGNEYSRSSAGVRSYCVDCVSLSNKANRRRKLIAGECNGCKLPAIYGGFCEWHWFRGTVSASIRSDKRRGIHNDTNRDDLTRYAQSIYPKGEVCPYCGVTITRDGGSVSDGIKSSHQNNASLDAIHSERGHVIGNLVWVCGRCNRDKSSLSTEEIRNRVGWHERVLKVMEKHE